MLPKEKQPFKISKIALGLLLASILLANILAIMTTNNIRREQEIMESFLLKEGLALIRILESSAGTILLHHDKTQENPLDSLVDEHSITNAIAYIRIIAENNRVITTAGDWLDTGNRPTIEEIHARSAPYTALLNQAEVFELIAPFKPFHNNDGYNEEIPGKYLIYIGLQTTDFDHARQEDVRHRLLMGGLLFLLSCTCLYFLYLYHGMRVARTRLANLQLYTENVIRSMPAGLLTLNRQNQIVSFNEEAMNLAGTRFSSLHNTEISEVFAELSHELIMAKQPLLDQSFDFPHANGDIIPVNVSSSNLLNEDGKNIGTVLILRDMRDIRAIERQLERSRRLAALGQMAAGIAHEIRNPLGTLRGFAQFFSKQFNKGDDGREYAELMIGEVDRLNHTISALLQFARPREPEMQEICLCNLLNKTYNLLEHDFIDQQKGLRIECSTDLSMRADPDLLLQVLINLIKNSMEVTLKDGCIELGAVQDGKNLRLWVQDTGRGMTADEKERMFDPFFTTKKTGTGLGLAVSHQIIERHHGYFEVTSSPGHGTRIDIIFSNTGKRIT